MQWILRRWDFVSAISLTILGIYLLPHNAVRNITTELIAFFSIQSAVILPAMIFTAGILKPDGLELEEAKRYHKALKAQMLFWVALLGLDFVAVVSLIFGKALNWNLAVPVFVRSEPINLGWLLPSILYFSGSLAVFRTIPFVGGVISLLDVNSEMTLKAIVRRNKLENAERNNRTDKTSMVMPEGYGKIVSPEGD